MGDLETVKTPEARRESSYAVDDQKDEMDPDIVPPSANRASRSAMSPGVESLRNIQFMEPAEGTPAALALAGKETRFLKIRLELILYLTPTCTLLFSQCCHQSNKV